MFLVTAPIFPYLEIKSKNLVTLFEMIEICIISTQLAEPISLLS